MTRKIAFSESVHATGTSRWHIRVLSDRGPTYTGGADTKALCGRVVAWDLKAPVTKTRIIHSACTDCAVAFGNLLNKGLVEFEHDPRG